MYFSILMSRNVIRELLESRTLITPIFNAVTNRSHVYKPHYDVLDSHLFRPLVWRICIQELIC